MKKQIKKANVDRVAWIDAGLECRDQIDSIPSSEIDDLTWICLGRPFSEVRPTKQWSETFKNELKVVGQQVTARRAEFLSQNSGASKWLVKALFWWAQEQRIASKRIFRRGEGHVDATHKMLNKQLSTLQKPTEIVMMETDHLSSLIAECRESGITAQSANGIPHDLSGYVSWLEFVRNDFQQARRSRADFENLMERLRSFANETLRTYGTGPKGGNSSARNAVADEAMFAELWRQKFSVSDSLNLMNAALVASEVPKQSNATAGQPNAVKELYRQDKKWYDRLARRYRHVWHELNSINDAEDRDDFWDDDFLSWEEIVKHAIGDIR